jgi:hypothetical protein
MQLELARFGAERTQAAFEAQARLLASRSPGDLLEAWDGYLRHLAEDYAREANRVLAHGMGLEPGREASR